ncbi:MAG: hypothetical protein QW728_04835 [Thermoplasmata archaeon]
MSRFEEGTLYDALRKASETGKKDTVKRKPSFLDRLRLGVNAVAHRLYEKVQPLRNPVMFRRIIAGTIILSFLGFIIVPKKLLLILGWAFLSLFLFTFLLLIRFLPQDYVPEPQAESKQEKKGKTG